MAVLTSLQNNIFIERIRSADNRLEALAVLADIRHAVLLGVREHDASTALPAMEQTASVTERVDHSAGSILREAAGIVEGSRQQTHGDKERSFTVIADLWNTYLRAKTTSHPGHTEGLNGADVAVLMTLLKVARAASGTAMRDHFTDMAGYAALAGELAVSN